jgi:hypothetical protein
VDDHVELLARVSDELRTEYADDTSEWKGSPFEWIMGRPSRQVGKIGEQLVSRWCRANGLRVGRSPDQEADRIIEGLRVEIKYSRRWQNGGYVFQQLRDQNYDLVICLGLSPFDAHCWVLTKEIVMEQWRAGNGLQTQHGGRRGSDTAWLAVDPMNPPAWLAPLGGSLAAALDVLEGLLGGEAADKR